MHFPIHDAEIEPTPVKREWLLMVIAVFDRLAGIWCKKMNLALISGCTPKSHGFS